jgi:hypothetical protein
MALNLTRELAVLESMKPAELKQRYAELFGEQPRSRNKVWLVRRIAWRLQANEEGDLSERARRRALELANDADLRATAPRRQEHAPPSDDQPTAGPLADRRLPLPGAEITRPYKGQLIVVRVQADGFQYEGQLYRSLSAVAKAVTGKHWNGYHFFGLTDDGGAR